MSANGRLKICMLVINFRKDRNDILLVTFCGGSTGVHTQNFVLARQILYHSSHTI
jgi:hypothetical protein